MARRSSRLRGNTPAQSTSHASSHLESLAERDETPANVSWPSLDAIVSSPLAPRTPATASRPVPGIEEMHPSKAQQSTAQKPDSGLRLGFTDIKTTRDGRPVEQSPSKTGISNSSFDFRFARPGPTLGPEAQRMMDELREEALRIKVRLAAEKKEKQERGEEDTVTGRKIAQPKGKVGRYSDIHMEEFKKMDSIAGHASSFRGQPGRVTPAKSLKRTQSKANLDEKEAIPTKIASPMKPNKNLERLQITTPVKTLKRTQSRARLDEREDIPTKIASPVKPKDSERLENTASAKRARINITDDTSSVRPVSSDTIMKPMTPSIPRSQSSFLSAISTPTQSSLARASGAKPATTQIPTLSRSPSKPSLLGTPRGLTKSATTNDVHVLPKSEPRGFLRSPGKFDRVKSILRKASDSIKKPHAKPSSIPSLTRTPSKPNLNPEKTLPSVPGTPRGPVSTKAIKHVNFTPETIKKNAATFQNSPSSIKSGIPRSTSRVILSAKSPSKLKSNEVQYPSIADLPEIGNHPQEVEYPSLAGVRPLPVPPQFASTPRPPPSVPGTFTFRSDHTINFGASPKGFGSSPGQASLRQVRQSIAPSMPGSFPGTKKENSQPLPSFPHGMSNKKRHRMEDDETEDDFQPSPKKRKEEVAEGPMLMAPRMIATPKSRLNSPAKKGALSLSRLNMLARPKNRK
ncbi:hypothetical protein LSUE1_G007039 [Lachnellula suecica]|uniref:Erythromycin esterase n=1 Tax=Lachnellula suecica TaxID=602035 RepID=A0A8T9BWL9_9HELO|nr:hypothetical protein LSUE1_G007039 [Lachnellula suecica]